VRLAVPLLAVSLPVCTALLFLARNHLATGGAITPPLDDTYIYFQYARTFARGEPFSWLPGGGYTTGATSMIYVPLLALGWALGARGPWLYAVAWGLGLLFFALALWRMGRWLEREISTAAAVGGLIAAGSSGVVLWSVHSGMDGAVLLAAAVLAAEAVGARLRGRGPSLVVLAWLLGAMPLVRPEAGTIAILLGASLAACAPRGYRLRTGALLVGPAVAVTAALALLNATLTGSAATNGMITKSWMSDPTRTFSERVAKVLAETGVFLERFALPRGPAFERALLAPLFIAGGVLGARRGRTLWLLAGVVLVGVGLTLQSSYANVHRNRYQAPFLAAGYALAGAALVYGLAWLASKKGPWMRYAAAGLGVVLLLASGLRDTSAWGWRFALDARDILRHPVAAGRWLKEEVAPSEVVAVHDAGAMPYFSDHPRFLDLVGLGTNGVGRWYRSGPGSLFERIESLPEEERPDRYAVYTDWFEDVDLLGAVRHRIVLERRSIVPNPVLTVLDARGELFTSGHRPWLRGVSPEDVLDAVDLADLDSEEAHSFDHGDRPGPTRYMRGPTPEAGLGGDGARWVRGPVSFVLRPRGEPARLVLRVATPGGSKLAVQVGDGAPVSLTFREGKDLVDRVVTELPIAGGEQSPAIRLSPEGSSAIFVARAYLVRSGTGGSAPR